MAETATTARNSVRPQKARTRGFKYVDNSRPPSRVPKDDKTLKRTAQVELVRPKWTGASGTTFRPLPMFNPDNPNGPFDPTRLSTDPFDFSDFTRGLPAAKYVGIDNKYTFITHDPRWVQDRGYDPRRENPYYLVYNAVMDAVKNTGEAIVKGRNVMTTKWSPLTVDGPKKALNSPTTLYYMQGLIYEHDGDAYVRGGRPPKGMNEEDQPQIIQISKTAGVDLAKMLNKVNPEYSGDTDIDCQAEMYLLGDLVNLVSGGFVTFYNPDKHDVGSASAAGDEDEADDKPDADDGGSRAFKSWKVAVAPTFNYVNKRKNRSRSGDIVEYQDGIRAKLQWWDDILHIPETEEICLMMAQAFKSMPKLLEFGWMDNPEFFTDDVNGVLNNRTAVAMPATEEDEEDDGDESDLDRSAEKLLQRPRRSSALPKVEAETEEEGEETEAAKEDRAAQLHGGYGDEEEEEANAEELALEKAAQAALARSRSRMSDKASVPPTPKEEEEAAPFETEGAEEEEEEAPEPVKQPVPKKNGKKVVKKPAGKRAKE